MTTLEPNPTPVAPSDEDAPERAPEKEAEVERKPAPVGKSGAQSESDDLR